MTDHLTTQPTAMIPKAAANATARRGVRGLCHGNHAHGRDSEFMCLCVSLPW
jgi:hypothetical protein